MKRVIILLNMLVFFALSAPLTACDQPTETQQQESIAKDVDAAEFKKLIDEKGGQVLDVRTPEEIAQGYVPNALQHNFYDDNFSEQVAELDKDKPVFVYCAAGGRSGQAMKMMNKMGFKEVYNLAGGFPTWSGAGYEVAK